MANLTKTVTFGQGSDYRPYGVVYLEETGTSTANNTSTVVGKLTLKRPYQLVSTATRTATLTLNGTTYSFSGAMGGTGDYTLITKTITVTHESSGAKSMTYEAYIALSGITWGGTSIPDIRTSGSFTLTKLDRYPTASVSLTSRTETSLTFKWSSDSTISKVEYSTNGGTSYATKTSNANATSGSITVSSLSANTSYSVRVRLTSKSTSLATASSSVSMKTYAWPYASSLTNFTIGGKWGFTLYNPLSRTVTIRFLDNNGNAVGDDDEFNGTTFSGYMGTELNAELYASIPNSKSGNYSLRVAYGTHVNTKTGGVYSVNESASKPSIGTLTYEDVNETTQAIVNDPSKIVQNMGIVSFTAGSLTAKNSATVASVSVSVNSQSYSLDLNGDAATGGNATINSATNITATATVTDSRGLTATKTVTVEMLAYSAPVPSATVARRNNFYDETDITATATYSSMNGGNAVTFDYRYQEIGTSTWSSWASFNGSTTATLSNQSEWKIQVRVTDSVGGTNTTTKSISKGIPLFFVDTLRGSVGVNCIPQSDDQLWVNDMPFFAVGTWTPQLYDNSTYVQDLDDQTYVRIGNFYACKFHVGTTGVSLSSISTMLQIRGMPYDHGLGTTDVYIQNASTRVTNVQIADQGIYFRPNIKGSEVSNTGIFSFTAFGYSD